MKKLIIAFAAFALVTGVHAASVNWSSGRFYLPGDGGNGWSSTQVGKNETAYTFTLYMYTTYTDGVLSGALTLTGNTATSTGSNNSSRFYKGEAVTESALSSTSSYYLYAEIVRNADGATLSSQIMEMVWDGSLQDPSISFMSETADATSKWASKNGTFSSTYGYWNSTGWAAAVPEPTSGLLVLLGIAGFALKRKRA